MARKSLQRILLWAFLVPLTWAAVISANGRQAISEAIQTSADRIDTCTQCHLHHDRETVTLFKESLHARSGYTCNRCHGGDASAREKELAHSGKFIGKPSPNDVLMMCSACHRGQMALFKAGQHFPQRRGQPRLDCSQCHGAHAVGSAARNFSFVYYCAGCHGQEYLPELPEPFQKMLRLADDLQILRQQLQAAGLTLSPSAEANRKEIARRIAEIVHPTDAKVGAERIAGLLQRGEEVKKQIARELKPGEK